MNCLFDKNRSQNDALEFVLRDSAPRAELPPGLHDSIMRAVNASDREEKVVVSGISVLQRFARFRWLPVTGLAVLVLVSIWLMLPRRPEPTNRDFQSLPEISTAFDAGQEVVDTLPSVTVGPLSDELDKVNQDLDRTADFLLATLP